MAVGRRAHVQIALFVPPFLCFLRPFFSRNRISRLPGPVHLLSSLPRTPSATSIRLFRLRINPSQRPPSFSFALRTRRSTFADRDDFFRAELPVRRFSTMRRRSLRNQAKKEREILVCASKCSLSLVAWFFTNLTVAENALYERELCNILWIVWSWS